MLELILRLEQIAINFNPMVLIIPGLFAVLAGLFIWLGGLGLRKILMAIFGIAAGGICAFFIIGQNIIAIAFLAALCAFIAVTFQRIFITSIAAALALVLCFAVLSTVFLESQNIIKPNNQQNLQRRSQPYTVEQTMQVLKAYSADFNIRIKSLCLQMPLHYWVITATAGIIAVIAGLYLARFTCAFCCAAWGSVLIFAGMILLLCHKGAAPVTHIIGKKFFYPAVFAAMVAFGTAVQLLICSRKTAKKPLIKKHQAESKEQPPQAKPDWRKS